MTPTDPSLHALILAGGAGTRFWPASRAARPKQLLPLLGGEPLLAATARRVLPLCAAAGGRAGSASGSRPAGTWSRRSDAALPEVSERRLLVEPAPRNTAPCIGWAAATVARDDPEAVVMVLPSDHHIGDVPRFLEALRAAVASAQGGAITTIGVRPTHPETGFGYIEAEEAAGREGAAPAEPRRVRRFVEKPEPRARRGVRGERPLPVERGDVLLPRGRHDGGDPRPPAGARRGARRDRPRRRARPGRRGARPSCGCSRACRPSASITA